MRKEKKQTYPEIWTPNTKNVLPNTKNKKT